MRLSKNTWVVGALALTMVTACDSSNDPGSNTSRPAGTTSTAPTQPTGDATPTTARPTFEDGHQQAAAGMVVDFWAALDRLSQDPEAPVQDIAQVAQNQAAVQWVSIIQTQREDDLLQTGDTEVTVTEVETVEDGKRYEVTACLDWSDVVFNGEKPDRGELGDVRQATYVVRYDELADRFFVAEDPLEYVSCDG